MTASDDEALRFDPDQNGFYSVPISISDDLLNEP
jgi:hypothetical protein